MSSRVHMRSIEVTVCSQWVFFPDLHCVSPTQRRRYSSPHVPLTFAYVFCVFPWAQHWKICNTVVDWRASSRDRSPRFGRCIDLPRRAMRGRGESWRMRRSEPRSQEFGVVLMRLPSQWRKLDWCVTWEVGWLPGLLEVAVRSVYFCGVVT